MRKAHYLSQWENKKSTPTPNPSPLPNLSQNPTKMCLFSLPSHHLLLLYFVSFFPRLQGSQYFLSCGSFVAKLQSLSNTFIAYPPFLLFDFWYFFWTPHITNWHQVWMAPKFQEISLKNFCEKKAQFLALWDKSGFFSIPCLAPNPYLNKTLWTFFILQRTLTFKNCELFRVILTLNKKFSD